jgi:hypothetical protein
MSDFSIELYDGDDLDRLLTKHAITSSMLCELLQVDRTLVWKWLKGYSHMGRFTWIYLLASLGEYEIKRIN